MLVLVQIKSILGNNEKTLNLYIVIIINTIYKNNLI